MFRTLAKAAVAISFVGIAACGGDEKPTGHSDLVDEATGAVIATVDVLNGAPSIPKLAAQSKDLAGLLERANAIPPLPSDESDAFTRTFRAAWEPALGKLYAASLATLENPDSSSELSTAIRDIHAKATELDKVLSGFLAPKR